MSPHPTTSHAAAAHGSLQRYTTGFALSLLLTFGSFGAVMSHLLPGAWRLPAVVVLCVAQLLVQLGYFLHIGRGRDQRSNTVVFLCTAALIAIVVAGSLWVMHNANTNMMPAQPSPAEARFQD